jgi:hypothetical protein
MKRIPGKFGTANGLMRKNRRTKKNNKHLICIFRPP